MLGDLRDKLEVFTAVARALGDRNLEKRASGLSGILYLPPPGQQQAAGSDDVPTVWKSWQTKDGFLPALLVVRDGLRGISGFAEGYANWKKAFDERRTKALARNAYTVARYEGDLARVRGLLNDAQKNDPTGRVDYNYNLNKLTEAKKVLNDMHKQLKNVPGYDQGFERVSVEIDLTAAAAARSGTRTTECIAQAGAASQSLERANDSQLKDALKNAQKDPCFDDLSGTATATPELYLQYANQGDGCPQPYPDPDALSKITGSGATRVLADLYGPLDVRLRDTLASLSAQAGSMPTGLSSMDARNAVNGLKDALQRYYDALKSYMYTGATSGIGGSLGLQLNLPQVPSSSFNSYLAKFPSSGGPGGGSPGSSTYAAGSYGPLPARAAAGGGFLYRQLDFGRLAGYVQQLKGFVTQTENFGLDAKLSQVQKVCEDEFGRADGRAAGGPMMKTLPSLLAPGLGVAGGAGGATQADRQAVANAKVAALRTLDRQVRGLIGEYVHAQQDFALKRFSDGHAYLRYWTPLVRAAQAAGAEQTLTRDAGHARQVGELVDQYQEGVKQLVEKAKDALEGAAGAFKTWVDQRASTGLDAQQGEVNAMLEATHLWALAQVGVVQRYHSQGGATLADLLGDPGFWVMYGLKLVRFFLAWLAVHLASRALQHMYVKQVYDRQRPPPNPLLMVAMFLALDLAFCALVTVVLLMVRALGSSSHLGGDLLRQWAADVALSTPLVGLLAAVLALVVRRKKYFRYKYEGERGIRALESMVLACYGVFLAVPLFRLV